MNLAFLMLQSMKSQGGVGYSDPSHVVFEANLAFSENIGANGVQAIANGNEIEAGKSYCVTTDSGTVSCVCKKLDLGDTVGCYLGNMAMFGLEDTGEKFLVMLGTENAGTEDEVCAIMAIDLNNGTHMKVSTVETIHTIAPKFIPGAVLPVVEITSANYLLEGEPVKLSQGDDEKLDAAAKTGLPAVIKFSVSIFGEVAQMVAVFLYVSDAFITCFPLAETGLMVCRDDDGWYLGEV